MRTVFYLVDGRWVGCAGVARHVSGVCRAWAGLGSVTRACQRTGAAGAAHKRDEKGGDDRFGHHGQGLSLSAERKVHGPLQVPRDESSAYGSCLQARWAMN